MSGLGWELPVVTERLVLRSLLPVDLDDLHAIYSRPEVMRYLYGDVQAREQTEQWLDKRLARNRLQADGDSLVVAVQRRSDDRVLGTVTLWWRSIEHSQGEVGFVFHPDGQGAGYAREASTAVIDRGFRELGLHRIYGRTDARNAGSAALMRRLGMRQEAHLRHNEWFKSEWGDELIFAILAEEWIAGSRPS